MRSSGRTKSKSAVFMAFRRGYNSAAAGKPVGKAGGNATSRTHAEMAAQNHLKKAEHSTLYVAVVAFFVTDLLISNVIAVKTISPFTLFGHAVVLQAADLIFPVTYILGDVLTEV